MKIEYPIVSFQYLVPSLICYFCDREIKPGMELYRIIISFGVSKLACPKCADSYK